ncbi:acid protease, partial [Ceratobasidium sp. AG-I]
MKHSLLSTSLLVSSASAFHLPFTRHVVYSKHVPMTKTSKNLVTQTGSLGLENTANNFYSAVLTVDGKDVPVSLDTGSTDLWLYDYETGLLDKAYVMKSLPLTDSYGLGNVTGYVSQIEVAFAGYTVSNQSFLYVKKESEQAIIEDRTAAGLLGLGFDTISNINDVVAKQYSGATWGRSLLSNIFLSDPSTPNHIAFHLDRLYDGNSTNTGSFDIGSFASGFEAVNDTLPIPIFSPTSKENIYWEVPLDGVAVNGQNQTLNSTVSEGDTKPPSGKLAAVLDTGFSLPQLTTDIAHAVYSSMGGVLVEDDPTNATYVVPCLAETKLTFYIGGRTIPIHPLDLTYVTTAELDRKNYTICINAFQPFTSEAGGGLTDLILGDAFLRNTYTVYDFGNIANGTSGQPNQNPFVKLLPLTDPTQASADFQTARKAYLDTLPPQLN